MTQRRVTTIPATLQQFTSQPITSSRKRRVAAYARVSTDSDEQLSSYEMQVRYYTDYIASRADWEFVGIYTDEGISGTNTIHREGFRQMMADAQSGKIDLIITKSVSRFARNTVDSLVAVRDLKARGVEIYFEKENIWTMDSKGELLITIMSSLAQEESRSISENVKWGIRKKFADGKFSMPYSSFLGYAKGEDGTPVIVEEEAEVVKLIYSLFLQGKSMSGIASYLTRQNIHSPRGSRTWSPTTVASILKNEKYAGNAVLQKTYITDFLTKKAKKNEGEVPKYYVENSHPAIISEATFKLVQDEFRKREKQNRTTCNDGLFSGRIFCSKCGAPYVPKTWHSTSKYRRVIWRCSDKYKTRSTHCDSPHFYEEELKKAAMDAISRVITNRDEIIAEVEAVLTTAFDTAKLKEKKEHLEIKAHQVSEKANTLIDRNSHEAIDQEGYQQEFDRISAEFNTIKVHLDKVASQIEDKTGRKLRMEAYLDELRKADTFSEFSEELFNTLVDHMTVYSKQQIGVTFRDGREEMVALG